MNVLSQYSLPYKGLGDGLHKLNFVVDDVFFQEFETPLINNGSFNVALDLDKKHDHSILDFSISGTTKSNCDRCLESINLPVFGEYRLHIKFGEETNPNEQIMFIHPETSILNLAQIIYEFIALSVPMIKVYNCREDTNPPCNETILKKLEGENEDLEENPENSIWSSLGDIKFDK